MYMLAYGVHLKINNYISHHGDFPLLSDPPPSSCGVLCQCERFSEHIEEIGLICHIVTTTTRRHTLCECLEIITVRASSITTNNECKLLGRKKKPTLSSQTTETAQQQRIHTYVNRIILVLRIHLATHFWSLQSFSYESFSL